MSTQKRLFLLDAFALIFRGYYAFIKNPIINSKGMDTSAIMGFMNSLLDVIKRENPDHLAVCFDKGGSVDRVEMFAEYKANRDETPEAIKIAVPYIQEILKAMHIPIMVKEGFEADDVIGTLAKKPKKRIFKPLWLHQIKILLNWFPRIFLCTDRNLVVVMKHGAYQKFKKNLKLQIHCRL